MLTKIKHFINVKLGIIYQFIDCYDNIQLIFYLLCGYLLYKYYMKKCIHHQLLCYTSHKN